MTAIVFYDDRWSMPEKWLTSSPESPDWSPIPAAGLNAARGWFDRQGVELNHLTSLQPAERAKRLNQAVYAFCETGATPADMNDLFRRCATACDGYAYLLRGLLEVTGAKTRYVRLYNIPNQGSHVGVEIRIGNEWGFLDPTFGAYFTDNGEPEGNLLSLREIANRRSLEELKTAVQQARASREDFVHMAMASLYGRAFEHAYMSLRNYIVAERITPDINGGLLALDIPLTIHNGKASIGSVAPGSAEGADARWQSITNALLNDHDPLNDVSFFTSTIFNDDELSRITTISIYDLEPGKRYMLTLLFVGSGKLTRAEVANIGKDVRFESRSDITIEPRKEVIFESSFVPLRSTAKFFVRKMGKGSMVRLYGVEAREIVTLADT